MRIAVIGLGIMGGAMSENLVRAGHEVVGYDVLASRRARLRKAGGTAARSVGEAVANAPFVITSLPSSAALGDGAGGSRMLQVRGPMMARRKYKPATMSVKMWQKDMAIIGEFARALDCPTPLFSATTPIYNAAMALGFAEHDTAAVCAVLEALAKTRRNERSRRAARTRTRR